MRTARSLPYGGGCLCLGGSWWGEVSVWGWVSVGGGGVSVQGEGGLCLVGSVWGWVSVQGVGLCPGGVGVSVRGSWQRPPPPWTEWHTGVKTLPCCNFVASGNNSIIWKLPVYQINAVFLPWLNSDTSDGQFLSKSFFHFFIRKYHGVYIAGEISIL